MTKKKRTILAEHEGKLYIEAKYAGMHFLCLLVDGISLTFFGKSDRAYLTIDQAIEWHQKEIKATFGKWDRKVLDALVGIKAKFDAGEIGDSADDAET